MNNLNFWKAWSEWWDGSSAEPEPKPAISRQQVIQWRDQLGSVTDDGEEWLEMFANLVADYEREECAKIADLAAPFGASDLIRERGKTYGA